MPHAAGNRPNSIFGHWLKADRSAGAIQLAFWLGPTRLVENVGKMKLDDTPGK